MLRAEGEVSKKKAALRDVANCGTLEPKHRIGSPMVLVRQTEVYANWFAGLRDVRARARIDLRIRRLALGNPGDVRPVGHGVSEMRIDYGPGYRLYFKQAGAEIVLLLCGGDKKSQRRDIATALSLAAED